MPALVRIEGIGETYADKLANARIGTTQTLLKRGATRQGRKEIATIAGVDGKKILSWVNRADLFRINGVGKEYSDLLEASEVDTVIELAQRNADHLFKKMIVVNERRNLVRRTPALSTVKDWIRQAKELPRVVEY
jgi:predicted flap endonuclease-1-like 5' DNA nuclease